MANVELSVLGGKEKTLGSLPGVRATTSYPGRYRVWRQDEGDGIMAYLQGVTNNTCSGIKEFILDQYHINYC